MISELGDDGRIEVVARGAKDAPERVDHRLGAKPVKSGRLVRRTDDHEPGHGCREVAAARA